MKKSGLTRLAYILEAYTHNKLDETYEQQIVRLYLSVAVVFIEEAAQWTIKSQTQLMDDFILLQADSINDVTVQLRRLHTMVKELYHVRQTCLMRFVSTFAAGKDHLRYTVQADDARALFDASRALAPQASCPHLPAILDCFSELERPTANGDNRMGRNDVGLIFHAFCCD